MSLTQVLQILWRRGWIAAVTFLVALAVAGAILLFVPGRYDAVARATIDIGQSDPVTGNMMSSTLVAIAQGNLISLVESERVALDVVRNLNLVTDPQLQANFRNSESFGRAPIENWIAGEILKSVDAKFGLGSNVLEIKTKSDSALRSSLEANAFMTATIDEAIAMRAASAVQTSSWYGPQIEALRADLAKARAALETFQQTSSMLPQLASGDSENSQLMSATQDLSTARATLSSLETRRNANSVDVTTDPQDPDVQVLTGLKTKLTDAQSNYEQTRSQLGTNNPKVELISASIRSLRAQITAATVTMRDHLDTRIASTKEQIKKLTAGRESALHDMIAVQGQRAQLNELQRAVSFKQEMLETQLKSAVQAQLQSKLTFSNIAVLDRATPPPTAAFPKPLLVLAVATFGSLALGIILALLAEALDRRVRTPEDLVYLISAPVLGEVSYSRRLKGGRPILRLEA